MLRGGPDCQVLDAETRTEGYNGMAGLVVGDPLQVYPGRRPLDNTDSLKPELEFPVRVPLNIVHSPVLHHQSSDVWSPPPGGDGPLSQGRARMAVRSEQFRSMTLEGLR